MDIKRCSVLLLVLVFAFGAVVPLLAVRPQADDSEAGLVATPKWPSLGGGFGRSGRSDDFGPLAGGVRWKFELGGAVVGSVTVGTEGRIHIACEDGKLYTLNSEGAALWTLDVNAPLLSAPSLAPDGSLYVGGKAGKLYAVTPDGQLDWTGDTGDSVYSSPAVGANGVYVGSSDGTLYALAKADGAELWRFKTRGPGALPTGAIFASPSIGADGTVYVAGLYDPNLYALNPTDGSVKWVCRFPPTSADSSTGGWPFASPVVAADGTIYQVLLYDPNLYAIEPADGTIRWSVNLCDPRLFGGSTKAPAASDGWSEPVLGPDGTIYVSLDDRYLRAVHPSGVLLWVTQLGSSPDDIYGPGWSDLIVAPPGVMQSQEAGGFTLTVDGSGIVYAASDSGNVYAVSPGSLALAQFPTGGWPAFPVIAADDLLVLADSKDYSSLEKEAKNAVWGIGALPTPSRR